MSYKSSLFEAIETIVNNYIEKVADVHGLNTTELKNLWCETVDGSTKQKTAPIFKKPEVTREKSPETCDGASNMSKMTKNELVDLCKAKGYKVTGTKAELIDRLTSCPQPTKNGKEIVVIEKSCKKFGSSEPSVISKLTSEIPTVRINKNVFGNYEHAETSLLFDDKTKKVIGKQNDDGTIANLTRDDMDICNKYKFCYVIPDNLNETKDKGKVTVSTTGDDEDDEDGSQFADDEFLEEEDEDPLDEEYVSDA